MCKMSEERVSDTLAYFLYGSRVGGAKVPVKDSSEGNMDAALNWDVLQVVDFILDEHCDSWEYFNQSIEKR